MNRHQPYMNLNFNRDIVDHVQKYFNTLVININRFIHILHYLFQINFFSKGKIYILTNEPSGHSIILDHIPCIRGILHQNILFLMISFHG